MTVQQQERLAVTAMAYKDRSLADIDLLGPEAVEHLTCQRLSRPRPAETLTTRSLKKGLLLAESGRGQQTAGPAA